MLECEVEEYTKLTKKLKKLNVDAHCTRFHGAGLHHDFYQVWLNHTPVSDECSNVLNALRDGINKLKINDR